MVNGCFSLSLNICFCVCNVGILALITDPFKDQMKQWIWRCLANWQKVKLLSRVWLSATPWTGAYQAPQSMELSRQEYWSGLPFPSPGDLPDPGTEPRSPWPPTLQADALSSERPGKPTRLTNDVNLTTDKLAMWTDKWYVNSPLVTTPSSFLSEDLVRKQEVVLSPEAAHLSCFCLLSWQ